MSEKPILFNTEMVRAIMDGRKTQTRRIIRPQPEARLCYSFAGSKGMPGTWGYPTRDAWERWGDEYRLPIILHDPDHRWTPPYKADDMLWVRETWNYGFVESSDREYVNDVWFEPSDRKTEGSYIQAMSRWWYKADANDEKDMRELHGFWRPAIHMPREAARIWLKVKKVKVQRLQEITDDDAKREGVECATDNSSKFRMLWDSITDARANWDANPWVWVIEFEKCRTVEAS
ncbi:MAG: hypothetical protein IKI81_02350 [Selenomonadaceae bacterium]|nr:hypothetical protein [Selenomonadaceae bacterium]